MKLLLNTKLLGNVQCDILKKRIAQPSTEVTCWKIAQESNDFRFAFNVCYDCIVYLYASDNPAFTRQEIDRILHERKSTCN